ncbi:keratin [Prionailurus iriomotensis]
MVVLSPGETVEIEDLEENKALCVSYRAQAVYGLCEEVQVTVQKHTQGLRHSKEELNRLNQAIQRLTAEVNSAKSQPCELDRAREPRALQESASDSAQGKLAWLEAALQRAKQDMASAAAGVPGAHDREAGPGLRDRHLPQAAGGRGEQAWSGIWGRKLQ